MLFFLWWRQHWQEKIIYNYYNDILHLALGKIFQHNLFSPHLPCVSKIIFTNTIKPSAAPLYIVVPSVHLPLPLASHPPGNILIPLSTFQWHPFWLCLTSWKSQIIQINRKQGEAFPLSKETNKPHEKEGVVEVVGGLCKENSHRCLRNRLKYWAKEKKKSCFINLESLT